MCALNFQTLDVSYQLNQALFADNGGCGYVLKPKPLDPITLVLTVMANVTDSPSQQPALEIELYDGLGTTRQRPLFNQETRISVLEPHIAMLRIKLGSLEFTSRVGSLQQGYRFVHPSTHSVIQVFSALLVKVDKIPANGDLSHIV